MSIPLRGVVATATFVLALGVGTGQALAADNVPDNGGNNVDKGSAAQDYPEGRPEAPPKVNAEDQTKGHAEVPSADQAGADTKARAEVHSKDQAAAHSKDHADGTPDDSEDPTVAPAEAQSAGQPSMSGLDSVTQREDSRLLLLQEAARRQRRALVTTWQRKADKAVRFAYRQQGRPYVWGGTGRRGYDCSGLVQRSWRQAGVSIPRVAADQYRRIRKHVGARELRPGDLVYFDHLGHVGLYVGRGHFIHAPHTGSHVQVTDLNSYWRAHLVGAARPAWPRLPVVPDRLA